MTFDVGPPVWRYPCLSLAEPLCAAFRGRRSAEPPAARGPAHSGLRIRDFSSVSEGLLLGKGPGSYLSRCLLSWGFERAVLWGSEPPGQLLAGRDFCPYDYSTAFRTIPGSLWALSKQAEWLLRDCLPKFPLLWSAPLEGRLTDGERVIEDWEELRTWTE